MKRASGITRGIASTRKAVAVAVTSNPIPEDLAKAFRDVVVAADIWYAAARELDILPNGISIGSVCLLAANYVEDMPSDVCSLLTELAPHLRLPPPASKSYTDGARCLLQIQRALLEIG